MLYPIFLFDDNMVFFFKNDTKVVFFFLKLKSDSKYCRVVLLFWIWNQWHIIVLEKQFSDTLVFNSN